MLTRRGYTKHYLKIQIQPDISSALSQNNSHLFRVHVLQVGVLNPQYVVARTQPTVPVCCSTGHYRFHYNSSSCSASHYSETQPLARVGQLNCFDVRPIYFLCKFSKSLKQNNNSIKLGHILLIFSTILNFNKLKKNFNISLVIIWTILFYSTLSLTAVSWVRELRSEVDADDCELVGFAAACGNAPLATISFTKP